MSHRTPRGHRWMVASRVLAAALGGYGLSALAMADLALLLPRLGVGRAEAVLTATLCSFVLYTVVAVWVFSPRSTWQVGRGLALAGGLLVLAYLGLQGAR